MRLLAHPHRTLYFCRAPPEAADKADQQTMRGRMTCSLESDVLNYWVAQALELPVIWEASGPAWSADVPKQLTNALGSLDFSTNWSLGGPILERNWAAIAAHTKGFGGDSWEKGVWQSGDLLEWSMKALVASKYGEYVPCDITQQPPLCAACI